jgi:hypothetical protein
MPKRRRFRVNPCHARTGTWSSAGAGRQSFPCGSTSERRHILSTDPLPKDPEGTVKKTLLVLSLTMVLVWWPTPLRADPPAEEKPEGVHKTLREARAKGLDWMTKNQAKDGSWGKTYTLAITSFTCLAYLADAEEPFIDERGKALLKGLQFLLSQQTNGQFVKQGHTWIHGQGFATLALSEAYGRSLLCKTKPDMDMNRIGPEKNCLNSRHINRLRQSAFSLSTTFSAISA